MFSYEIKKNNLYIILGLFMHKVNGIFKVSYILKKVIFHSIFLNRYIDVRFELVLFYLSRFFRMFQYMHCTKLFYIQVHDSFLDTHVQTTTDKRGKFNFRYNSSTYILIQFYIILKYFYLKYIPVLQRLTLFYVSHFFVQLTISIFTKRTSHYICSHLLKILRC